MSLGNSTIDEGSDNFECYDSDDRRQLLTYCERELLKENLDAIWRSNYIYKVKALKKALKETS